MWRCRLGKTEVAIRAAFKAVADINRLLFWYYHYLALQHTEHYLADSMDSPCTVSLSVE